MSVFKVFDRSRAVNKDLTLTIYFEGKEQGVQFLYFKLY